MSENYNNLPEPNKSRRMLDEEKEAIEKWRPLYPDKPDEELLEIAYRWEMYAKLIEDVARNPEKPEE